MASKFKGFWRKIFRWFLKAMMWFFIVSITLVVIYRFVPVPFTLTMVGRSFEQLFNDQEMVWEHDWVPLDEMSRHLPQAVVASEDNLFMKHHGFSFKAMKRAFEYNKKGKKVRGGSTISQQTAKNVFLWQGRNYVRKGLEAYFTVLIELVWGKERIMEVYLNSIEMGNGIYGAEAAARYWYGKSAKQLSRREAAGIAAILPNPRKFKASHSSKYIEGRKTKIQKVMRQIGPVRFDKDNKKKE